MGATQADAVAWSSEQWKVEPLSVDANENETALPEVAPGLDVMLVSGGDRSTTHVKLAGVASVLPAASVAATWKVWPASVRGLYVLGDAQAVSAAPSSPHLKLVLPSGALNVKVALVAAVSEAGLVPMTVSGAVVSIVHVYVPGVVSTFPAASVALTLSVCWPSASDPVLKGEEQTPKAPLSTMHWNVEPVSVLVNANCGLETFDRGAGLVEIEVSGGVRSIVHVCVAAAPVLPIASVALTEKVCEPAASVL